MVSDRPGTRRARAAVSLRLCPTGLPVSSAPPMCPRARPFSAPPPGLHRAAGALPAVGSRSGSAPGTRDANRTAAAGPGQGPRCGQAEHPASDWGDEGFLARLERLIDTANSQDSPPSGASARGASSRQSRTGFGWRPTQGTSRGRGRHDRAPDLHPRSPYVTTWNFDDQGSVLRWSFPTRCRPPRPERALIRRPRRPDFKLAFLDPSRQHPRHPGRHKRGAGRCSS